MNKEKLIKQSLLDFSRYLIWKMRIERTPFKPLKEEIKHNLERAGCIDKVSFEDWVPHENVPSYLNKMKIHVLPSHTEALGGTNLEAMACGTISIVNSVGGLSDVVIDGETGFLLKNNSPQTIADKVIEVLDYPDLRRIQRNARAFMEANYSYDQVKEQWKCVFSNLSLRKGVGHEYTPI